MSKEYNDGSKPIQNEYVNRPTPLQAFNNLCGHLDYDTTDYMFNGGYEEDSKIIETALKNGETLCKKYRTTNKRLKAKNQKYKKALEIIKKKGVNIRFLKETDNVMEYNELILSHYGMFDLSTTEYEFLKEILL